MKLGFISILLVSAGLMCSTVKALAGVNEDLVKVRADCDVLPDPDIPGYAGDAYNSVLYTYGTFTVFKLNKFDEDELREYDSNLISILHEMYKTPRYNFIKDDLESKTQESLSNFMSIMGSKYKLDEDYLKKAMLCFIMNAFSERGSLANQHVMFAFQQEIVQADYYADPTVNAAEQARVQRVEAANRVLDQRAKDAEKVRTQPSKAGEPSHFQSVESDENKLVKPKGNSVASQKKTESTDPDQQFQIGMTYEVGPNGAHNPQQSMLWFRKSAEQGNGRAQYFLGSHYLMGDGVPVDKVQAYVWFSVSAANGYYPATQARDVYGLNLSESQRTAAQELAKQYFEKYQPKNRSRI